MNLHMLLEQPPGGGPGWPSVAGESLLELSIVVPVYRSAECLRALVEAIGQALAPIGHPYEIVLVNDDSPDEAWAIIEGLCKENCNVVGIDLRRNFGQDNALLTGIRVARGRYIAVMDDDLQHDPKDLPRLLHALKPEFDVVYADFRKKHQKLWKNAGSWLTGKCAEWLLHKPKDIYLSPYKVFRREIAELVCEYRGPEPYLDGLLLQVTSRITRIPADHQVRYAGQSNYTLYKSIRVWARLVLSFSVKPLRIVAFLGITLFGMGLLAALAVILYRLLSPESFGPNTVGWASLAVVILLIGGVQMIFLGILGEYAGRTYLRVNDRPQTAIRAIIGPANLLESIQLRTWRDSAAPQGMALTNQRFGPSGSLNWSGTRGDQPRLS
jgi:undecaprenyl-phosphate 4-deoxy-4-formamido-L-arabinose transferase